MKALLSTVPGGPETLSVENVPSPQPGAGEVVIRVRACAVNYPDVLMIEDKYQVRPPRPFAPGCEIAGEVQALGPGVSNWSVGDRVVAMTGFGGMAQVVAVPADELHMLRDNRSFVEGAALIMAYATAHHALVDRGAIQSGETLLVLGASGGVGSAAIELGKAYGCNVVAGVSSEEKAGLARDLGANATVIYPTGSLDKPAQRALAEELKVACGDPGAHLIYDPVGGEYCEPALRSIAWGGRYLVVGFPAGIPQLALNLVLLKGCDIRGVFWGAHAAREKEKNRRSIATLFDLWDQGAIAPRVMQTYSLEEGGKAIAALGSRQAMGKLVVSID